MATHLDLEEQEQLAQLKSFWNQYGNLITWMLILVLGGYAAWNGWNWWQREQATKAAALFDELDRAAQAGDVDKVGRAFDDLKERYPGTAFAEQGGLLAAKVQADKGNNDAARASLGWVAEHAVETEYRTAAKLRLAGVLMEAKQYDEALQTLDSAAAPAFEALIADRRGDVLLAMGRKDDAKAAYEKARGAMDSGVEYRRLIEAKLAALGAAAALNAAVPAAGASESKP